MPLSFHTPAALGWVAEPPCFRDPRRCPWLQGLCVGLGVGGGEGQGRGTGEEIPHQESQRQGRALPQEPPLCPSILPFQVACCFSFPPPPPALLSAAWFTPTPGSQEKSTNGESPTNAKRLEAPSTSPGRPCSRRTGHLLCPRGVPTPALLWAEPPHPGR